MAKENLGIRSVHSVELAVYDAGPWLKYFTDGFGFQLIAASTGPDVEKTGTRRRLLRCGDVCIVIAERVHAGSRVGRFLGQHPEGVSRVNFLVRDLRATEQALLERHATPTNHTTTATLGDGEWGEFCIATPLGDVEFCFVACSDSSGELMAAMEPNGLFDAGRNPLGLLGFDHMTSNLRTLMPTLAFYEHVMGFRRCWDVHFHTEDIRPGIGTGLKSVVMADEQSGVKMAINEPLRPRFNESQVQMCIDSNRGPGVHHLAFEVDDIIRAVDYGRQHEVAFLTTPRAYHRALPARIKARKISGVTQPIEEIESHGILLDGDANGYLLQAFCREQSVQFDRPNAGPMFLEMVQRCGSKGFGEGNFRALFEAMAQHHGDAPGSAAPRLFADD